MSEKEQVKALAAHKVHSNIDETSLSKSVLIYSYRLPCSMLA